MTERIAILRIIVLFLGEKSQYGWWQSDFFNQTSENFLKPIFPKSILLSRYTGALKAANRVHEEFIGLGQVLHLFHTPEYLEQRIYGIIGNDEADFSKHIESPESALLLLKNLAKSEMLKSSTGPILLDTIKSNEITEKHIEKMAAMYLSAFESNIKTFPYIRVEN